MPGDNLEEIEPLLSWYEKGADSVKVVSLGLDGRTVLLDIRGKKNIRLLVALYDPSSDGNFSMWLRDLIESHKRAGIEFNRVEFWTLSEIEEELLAEYG